MVFVFEVYHFPDSFIFFLQSQHDAHVPVADMLCDAASLKVILELPISV